MAAAFGTVSLLLACIGLYGILAYTVARRTNEMGIRMALGATRNDVVWLVLREGFTLTAGGVLLGVPIVVSLGQIVRALLYGVAAFDPIAFAAAALLLLTFAGFAAALPGRRAGLLDPADALRRE